MNHIFNDESRESHPELELQSCFTNVNDRDIRLWLYIETQITKMRAALFFILILLLVLHNPFAPGLFAQPTPLEQHITIALAIAFLVLALFDVRRFRSQKRMLRHILRLAHSSRHQVLGLTMFGVGMAMLVAYREQSRFISTINGGFEMFYFDMWWQVGGVIAFVYGFICLYRASQVKKLRKIGGEGV